MEKEIDKSFSLNILRHNFDFEEYEIFIEYVFKKIRDINITNPNILKTNYLNAHILGKYECNNDFIVIVSCKTSCSIFNSKIDNYLKKLTENIGGNIFVSVHNKFQNCWRLIYISLESSILTNSFIIGKDINANYIFKGFENIARNKNNIITKIESLFSCKNYENSFLKCYVKVCDNIINNYFDYRLKNNVSNNKYIIEEFEKSKTTNIWINKNELFVNKILHGLILLKFILEKANFYNSSDYVYNILKKQLGQNINININVKDILQYCKNKGINFYCNILCPVINSLYKNIGISYTLYYRVIDIPNSLFLFIEESFNDYSFNLYPNDIYDKYVCIKPEIFSRLLQIILRADYKKYNGTYYTPKQVVRYMCNNSIINYLLKDYDNKIDGKYDVYNDNIYKSIINDCKNKSILVDEYNKLNVVKIVDLCVGSGEFIIEIVKIMVNIKKEIAKCFFMKKFDVGVEVLSILNKNIFAYDIEIYALVVTKIRLYFLSESIMFKDNFLLKVKNKCKPNFKLYDMKNIQLKDSLEIDKNCFNNFDIVVGNPPYVGEKSDKDYFRKISKSEFGNIYYCAKMDLFYYFFHKALDILNIGGTVNFITTNYFLTANGAYELRKDIYKRSKVIEIVNFNDVKLFNNALGQHNQITFLQKTDDSSNSLTKIVSINNNLFLDNKKLINIIYDKDINYYVDKENLYDTDNYYIRVSNISSEINCILKKISLGILLSEYCNINQGLVSGADKLTCRHIRKYNHLGNIGEGIFVITNSDLNKLDLNKREFDVIKPFYKNSDINKYKTIESTDRKVLYINKDFPNFNKMYPNIYVHLLKYKKILSDRREVKKDSIKFYMLQWPRKETIFTSEKIVCPQRSSTNMFAYNYCNWYSSADVYYITKKNKNISLKYILAILNSNLYYVWFYYKGKRKGNLLELYQTPLKETPIIIDVKYKDRVEELVDKILLEKESSKIVEYDKQINSLIYKIYSIDKEEVNKIEKFLYLKLYKNKK